MDEDAKKIRSSLMAISLYLILYWLADGNIGPAGEVKIGTISFGNPLWIKAAGLSIFFYLLWRYHIYGKIAFDEFKADIYLKLVANSEYIDYVVGCETLRQSLWDESLGQLDKQRTRWPVVSYSKDPADPQDVTMPPLPRGYFYPDIIYSSMKATRGAMEWVKRVKQIKNGTAENREMMVSDLKGDERREIRRFVFKAFKESLQSSNDFYQIIVPYILAAFAIFSLMAKASLVLALTVLTITIMCTVISFRRS